MKKTWRVQIVIKKEIKNTHHSPLETEVCFIALQPQLRALMEGWGQSLYVYPPLLQCAHVHIFSPYKRGPLLSIQLVSCLFHVIFCGLRVPAYDGKPSTVFNHLMAFLVVDKI